MEIIVVGAGKIGTAVTASLAAEGHNLCVIDIDPKKVNSVAERYDVMGLCGNGAIYETLLEAGALKADLLIAVTASDELNILCCLVAEKIGVKHTIARVRDPEYEAQLSMITGFGVSLTVNPELDAAIEISRILRFPSVDEVQSFLGGKMELVRTRVDAESALAGLTLRDISKKTKSRVLICAVSRDEEVFIPGGSFVLQAGDFIHLAGQRNDLSAFMKMLGEYKQPLRNVLLVGGGRIGYYLSRQLHDAGMTVKLMEDALAKCESLASLLSDTSVSVVCADGTSQEELLAQGIASQDAFVALADTDEPNIVMSMYAKRCGVKKVVTKVNRFPSEMLNTFGLDSVISPRSLTATHIVAYIRSLQGGNGGLRSLSQLFNGKAEALEFDAVAGDKCLSVPLCELKLRPDLLVAAIMRKNKIIHPCGNDAMEVGDRVIVVTKQTSLTRLDDILG